MDYRYGEPPGFHHRPAPDGGRLSLRRGRRDGHEARALLRGGGESGPSGPVILLSARGALSLTRMPCDSRWSRISPFSVGTTRTWTSGWRTTWLRRKSPSGISCSPEGRSGALVMADAVVRLLPGALGDHESASSDSFYDGGQLSPPSYTRPAEYRGLEVPRCFRAGTMPASRRGEEEAAEDHLSPGASSGRRRLSRGEGTGTGIPLHRPSSLRFIFPVCLFCSGLSGPFEVNHV